MISSYAGDETTNLVGVAMEAPIPKLDRALGDILSAADAVSAGSFVLAVTATGSGGSDVSGAFPVADVEGEVEASLGSDVIEASIPGGFFLDQDGMIETGLSDDRVVTALRQVKAPSGEPLFADVFPAIAVTFARYC
jgi:hypothetical protein